MAKENSSIAHNNSNDKTSSSSSSNILHGDILRQSLNYLEWKEIVALRKVSTNWKQTVAETPVEEEVHVPTRHVLRSLQKSIPKLQSLTLDQRSDPDMFQPNDDEVDVLEFADVYASVGFA